MIHPRRVRLYMRDAARAGVRYDQWRNFVSAALVLQPRQLEASALARLCDEPDGPVAIGYGGARGGGKSHWLLAQMGADDCQRVPGLKCLLLRKVGKANIENLEDLRKRLFNYIPHEMQVHRGILCFGNGSRIVAGHFQSEKDIDAYLGLEYDIIGIEEATTLTARKYADIRTCARSSKVLADGRRWRPRIYSTTNPGGVGHAWYKAEFIDPHARGFLHGPTRFVPARVADNPFVNPEYSRNLESLTGWQRAAWYSGSWDFAAGQYFTTWDETRHVVELAAAPVGGCWIGGFDYGFAHWCVFLLGHVSEKGLLTIVDEVALRQVVPETMAAALHAKCARYGVKVPRLPVFCGPDVCRRDSQGRTVQDEYRRHGIRLVPGSPDRVSGWSAIVAALGDPRNGVANTMVISRRCEHLLSRLPVMQVDPNRAEDVLKVDCDEDGEGGDDSPDALRYMVGTRKTGQAILLRL